MLTATLILIGALLYYGIGVYVYLAHTKEENGQVSLSDLCFAALIFWLVWPVILVVWKGDKIVVY